MTERTEAATTHRPLEADEFVCSACGAISREHDKDGIAECIDCVERAENGSEVTA